MKKYKCLLCGYVYEPAVGDPDNGVEPGTDFEDLPDDWVCPECGADKDEFEPIEDFTLLESLLRKAKQAGVTTVSCNIECFDESIREDIMPLKGKNSIEDYIKVWKKCVDIFEHNEVYTMAIAGLGESDESILRGVELAASMGVVCSIVPHTPMRHAAYEDMAPPEVSRMLYLYEEALPIYERYGLKLYGGTGGIYTSLKGM